MSKKKNGSLGISEINDFYEKLRSDPVKLKAFLRQIMGPPSRTLEGQEKENVQLMIMLRDAPDETSNNQRSICEVYHMNQKTYHVHYFEDETVIEEILNDEV